MVRGKLTFISGGVRSGKSAFAERQLVEIAEDCGGRLVYIASGTRVDAEMKKRIETHRRDRAENNWLTIEKPVNLEEVVPFIRENDFVLWDCLTTWLANELYTGWETGTACIALPNCMERKETHLYNTIEAILAKAPQLVIVSNEVLDDLPPQDAETKTYRRWLGMIHQKLVARANTAIEMEYGMPMFWKKGDDR
ncbi:bifunctional adenosylcobinamide kinase/adenosylcobinamide-phosphate guanylyltransferase [Sporosarcina jiandibaonis]|uniref:bifunctional adenosylcobinamide kinase/adenosylcobinamide-phosphate guanylyltransferase n=1 Tax=Sporosarcina jiandibaonis TaxID=2715535 RepID=UPI001555759F|nr:bifunctional adenosylcobinamide kinase/adenosylcobinamide-phosphate guanylyltransferase [Sporosarcina jiandibaonis]